MRKKILLIAAIGIFILACNTLMPQTPAEEAPVTPATEAAVGSDMAAKLEALGGTACEENPDFTCVTIQVPLNHFDAANTETLNVVFAVSPATGERYGMYVQAFPGGPGGEGISSGGLGWYPDAILEHYDIVYFDQRGIGLSNPLSCPNTYKSDFTGYLNAVDEAGVEGLDTPEEQQEAIDSARSYAEACVAEIGIDPAKLAFFGTDQVAEDIESFRAAIGDDKFMMYGVSYGTAVAQTYAAAHPEHLSGLVLDGTIDLTLNGEEGALSQEKAFDKVLVAALEACNADETCTADMGGDAVAVYDKLAKQISETPIKYEFPLPSGEKVERIFNFNQWESTAAYQLYSLSGRMLYLRALAAANRGDMIPMARLAYQNLTLDPATLEYLGDDTFSDTMFLGVLCTDDSFFSGTQDEKIEQTIAAGQASNGTVPRLDGSVYTGLSCAFWPGSPTEDVTTQPLVAEGVTTFVLNSTLDPATPFEEGKAVYENLADGYHLYVEGGRHSIYGFGFDCPDRYISDFMLEGTLPAEREIVCEDWGTDVIRAYEPLVAENISSYENVLEAFYAIDSAIQLQPEYFYGSFTEDVSIACPFSGTFTFGPSDTGEAYTFDNCAYTQGFALTGTGSYEYETGIITFETQVTGAKEGSLTYTDNLADGTFSVTGEYGGETIDLSQ
ncbi:MAG: alpha/beta fold hydrolase [Anaerolineales bacterium]|nr:alpha/beta fold hydrolase [Anaerolineales bacterium]